jgi:hypothetical protein
MKKDGNMDERRRKYCVSERSFVVTNALTAYTFPQEKFGVEMIGRHYS